MPNVTERLMSDIIDSLTKLSKYYEGIKTNNEFSRNVLINMLLIYLFQFVCDVITYYNHDEIFKDNSKRVVSVESYKFRKYAMNLNIVKNDSREISVLNKITKLRNQFAHQFRDIGIPTHVALRDVDTYIIKNIIRRCMTKCSIEQDVRSIILKICDDITEICETEESFGLLHQEKLSNDRGLTYGIEITLSDIAISDKKES